MTPQGIISAIFTGIVAFCSVVSAILIIGLILKANDCMDKYLGEK